MHNFRRQIPPVLLLYSLSVANAAFFSLDSVKKDPPKNSTQTGQVPSSKININHAALEELQALPGIGPAIAQRIVDYRKKNPPFRRVEDLLIIQGISKAKLEKIRDRVKLE
jgi:competence protein ComEA